MNDMTVSGDFDSLSLNARPPFVLRSDDRRQQKIPAASGLVVWLTGLPGAGKSSLAYALEKRLSGLGARAIVLDGDVVRQRLCADLGYSAADRNENMRRIDEVARLFVEQGFIVLVAMVSPTRSGRAKVRSQIPNGRFAEVFVNCRVETCMERDPKGMYARAKAGLIADFTGVSAEYEAPQAAELLIDTAAADLDHCVRGLPAFLRENFAAPG